MRILINANYYYSKKQQKEMKEQLAIQELVKLLLFLHVKLLHSKLELH